jgi:hypothetical protein
MSADAHPEAMSAAVTKPAMMTMPSTSILHVVPSPDLSSGHGMMATHIVKQAVYPAPSR